MVHFLLILKHMNNYSYVNLIIARNYTNVKQKMKKLNIGIKSAENNTNRMNARRQLLR